MFSSTNASAKDGSAHRLGRGFTDLVSSVTYGWKAIGVDIRNALRRMRRARLDYVVISVGGSLPERDGKPRNFINRMMPLPEPSLSMEQLNNRLQAVIDAPNVRGIVFVFTGLSARLATLQNFRASLQRLRAAGKEAIVYTPYLDMAHYYAATAADRIVAPPSAQFDVLGLFTEVTFLKDALARVGLEMDVVQISPYKTAFDRFSQSDITPENREQLAWLLDDQYDMLVEDLAAARNLAPDEIRALIDTAPFPVTKARESGLIDHVAYDDELEAWLTHRPLAAPSSATIAAKTGEKADIPATTKPIPLVHLMTWDKGQRMLIQRPRRKAGKFIGVISLEGMIVTGTSRRPVIDLPIPFIGGKAAGDQTLVSLLRKAEKLDRMAALLFHVDSGGGSALASDLIARQLALLNAKKPVVIYMGDIAASGGYYVSAPARHIMCQRATLTGSIGVITGRLSTAGAYERLSANRVSMKRGEHAGLYHDAEPWTAAERKISYQTVIDTYNQFKDVVSKNRGLTSEEVDEIGLGRVWTGRQALAHKLVDSHGDFLDAIKKAAELAALSVDDIHAIPVKNLFPRDSEYVLPAKSPGRAFEDVAHLLTGDTLRELSGKPLLLLPYDLRLR